MRPEAILKPGLVENAHLEGADTANLCIWCTQTIVDQSCMICLLPGIITGSGFGGAWKISDEGESLR